MSSIFRFVQVFALGTWLGGLIYLSFVVAPAAFDTLPSRDQAGTFVGLALTRLHVLGLLAALLYGAAAVAGSRSFAALARPAALLVLLMLLLTLASQWVVTPRMVRLRAEMVSVDATPAESPLRAQFDRLHRVSVSLESGVLLLGIAALYLTARQN